MDELYENDEDVKPENPDTQAKTEDSASDKDNASQEPISELKKLLLTPSTRKIAYAGFWRRFAAGVLDALLPLAIGVAIYSIVIVISPEGGDIAEAVALAVSVTLSVLTYWLYTAISESGHNHATPGKSALSLKVITQNGDHLSFDKTTVRCFCKFFSIITLGVGFLMCLFTKEKQCLHDKMAGCLIVRVDK